MEIATNHIAEAKVGAVDPAFVPLVIERRTTVDTATAALHLNRQPQTLRGWACLENGPLRPVRLNGRLAWKVEDIRRLLCVPPVDATTTGAGANPATTKKHWAIAKGSAGQPLPAGGA